MAVPVIRAFQWDLARQIERLEVLVGLLPQYAEWGYQELYLHLEDAVEYPNLPKVARNDAFSYREFRRLVDAAQRVGIGVVPIVNLLGHSQYVITVPEYRELNELRGEDGSPLVSGQICPLHPRTLEIADKLIGDMAPFCTAGKVHVGLDESFHLGKCPRCRAEVKRHGLAYHFANYVNRLHGLASARGLRMGMWADMLNFIPEAIPRLPRGIIAYDWYYYPFRRHPRVELFNFAESDLAPALKKRGIEYWGCPMNGAFRYEPLPLFKDRLANIRSWWKRCHSVGAGGMLITSWEAYRLALPTTTVVDAAAAALWLGRSSLSDDTMLEDGFARVFGKPTARRSSKVASSADLYPCSGYARWELNERWDVAPFSRPGAVSSVAKEVAHFNRLERASVGLPKALSASIAFRAYLARRDLFVCNAAQNVWRLRRGSRRAGKQALGWDALLRDIGAFRQQLHNGRKAAQAMWRLTRDPRASGQNEYILKRDAQRLASWQRWVRLAQRQPERLFAATPVCGVWQLSFIVLNFAPALQRVIVEASSDGNTWRELHGRYTIEFQAIAAQPRARVRRVFSVPIEAPDRPLRLAVKGLGEVRIEDVVVSDGLRTRRMIGPARFKLGEPAPKSGFPDISRRLDERGLRFEEGRNR